MSTFQEQEAQREAILAAREQAENDQRELDALFARRRDLRYIDANKSIVLHYFAGAPLTAATLDDAIENHPALRKQLKWQTAEEDRLRLEKAITALLAGSPDAIKSETAKFKYKSIEELATWHDELAARKLIRTATTQQLKSFLKATNATIPDLPAEYTRETLRKIPAPELRKLIERFGVAAINQRLK
jgi:hypothetical protein